MKNKYHRYSFHGLQVELKQINKKLKDPDTLEMHKPALLVAKKAIEKEIEIRKDPYYIPGSGAHNSNQGGNTRKK